MTITTRYAGLVSCALVAACGATDGADYSSSTAAVTFSAADVGFAPSGDISYGTAINLGNLRHDLADMQESGATWVRVFFEWNNIEKWGDNGFDWAMWDDLVAEIKAKHLKILACLTNTPDWARPGGVPSGDAGKNWYPANPASYRDFTYQFYMHYWDIYGADTPIKAYELWNEPNHTGFLLTGGASRTAVYVNNILIPGYQGLDQARTGRLWVPVISGGDATNTPTGGYQWPEQWYQGLYDVNSRIGSYMDGVGHHPYHYPVAPNDGDTGHLPQLYSWMSGHGMGTKKIWATEVGYPTCNGGYQEGGVCIDEGTQATRIGQLFTYWFSKSYAGPIFYFNNRDGSTGANDRDSNFGLVRTDFSRKPSYTAFKNALAGATTGAPDLVVTDVIWSPANPTPGQTVSFSGVVKNIGTAATPGGPTIDYAVILDGNVVGWGNVAGPLAPGAQATIALGDGPNHVFTWKATTGPHTVRGWTDDPNLIGEGNEANNTRDEALTVATNGPADLVVTDVIWSPANPAPGQTVSFSGGVKNVGGTATPAGPTIDYAVILDGNVIGWGNVAGPLAAGAQATIALHDGPNHVFTWKATSGAHTVRGWTDDPNLISEGNEGNNTTDEALTVP